MIIPKDFLKTLKRTGLGQKLFYEMRYDKNNNEIKDFILNQKEYKNAQILFTGDNFGCGSSREHAPWSISDFGIKCIISTSFADIFYNNCFKNSILPAIVTPKNHNKILDIIKASKTPVAASINIEKQIIAIENQEFDFIVDAERKKILIEGLDDIAQTLQSISSIEEYEKHTLKPWLKK